MSINYSNENKEKKRTNCKPLALDVQKKIKEIERLFLVVTNFCSSKCLLCSYWKDKEPKFISLSFIKKKVVPLIKKYNIKFICITGGEPTLHPKLSEIIKIIKKEGPYITLITNCIKLDRHFDKIKKYVDGYMISLDADTPTLFYKIRGNKNFLGVISWPDKIKRKSPSAQVVFSCLIQKKNFKKLKDIYLLASKTNVDGIFFRVPELKEFCFGGRNLNKRDEKRIEEAQLDKKEINELKNIFIAIKRLDSQRKLLLQKSTIFKNYIKYFRKLNGEKIFFKDRFCEVPLNSFVIDESKKAYLCFYLPFSVSFNSIKDPLNSKLFKNIRERLIKDKKFREKYCSYCLQLSK